MKKLIFGFNSIFLLVCSLIISSTVFAKEINLYDQPQDGAKAIGKVDLIVGVIPIFTSKDEKWMKVGDPRNGNVGWIKSNDVSDGGDASISYTQRVINTGKGPTTYQLMQFGKPDNMTPEQSKAMMEQMQKQQELQKNVEKTIQSIVENVNTLYQQQKATSGNAPMVMPIVILPGQKPAPAAKQPTTSAPAVEQQQKQ